ncbi:type II toxin-antitoxin system RelE family toxin [Trichloromonas sp.]|uniref:type II toxin-antitoxin system RelE family toxin n=1 Tax=Trichloromonas sp. TaxID=3069249 RepID=UPI002A3DE95E|nr:type II toxin-antitoxin system RelE/ParE family toxin [Trichloromonas sp.]
MFTVDYSKAARKTLKAMPRNVAKLICEKIEALAVDPFAANNNVLKLTNHPGYRLRVGDWRVVYLVHEEALLIAVVRIASRGDVYQ